MSKKTPETIYRSRPTKDRPKGDRWIFIEAYDNTDDWMMARVRDGHRMFCKPCNLTIEGTFPPKSASTIKQHLSHYEYNLKEQKLVRTS